MKAPAHPIRQKIGLLLLGITLLYTIVNHGIDRLSLRPGFLELEREQTLLDLRRCEEAIRREAYHLAVMAGDWAAWDDTYEFIRNVDEVYIDANLVDITFIDNHLDLIALFDESGNLAWGRAFDAVDLHPLPLRDLIPVPLPEALQTHHLDTARHGLLNSVHGPMVVATQPILKSNNEGPARGTFVMGRLLCNPVMDELRAQTGVPFSVTMAEEFDEREAHIFSRIREGAGVHLDLDDPGTLTAYSEMLDLTGNPAIVIAFSGPRVYMQRLTEVTRASFLGTLIGGLLILVCLLILLSWTVIRPMQSLAAEVTAIGASGDRSARLAFKRDDEIGMVANEFNILLHKVEEDFRSREEAAVALAASEKRLATLLDADPNTVLMLDTRGCIERTNPAGTELFGYETEQLLGRRLCSLIHDSAFDSAAVWNRTGEGVDAFRGEVEARRADGTAFPAYIVLRAFHLDGEIHRIAVLTDLSEFKRMHAAVLRARHLASLGELGATVAHELRNPIAGISNAVEVLGDGILPGDARYEAIDEVKRQARRVERTVRSLLDFARPWQVAPEPLALLPFAQDSWERLHKELGGEGVALSAEGDPRAVGMADPGLLEQVLRNVYENAVQAMEGAGHLHLSVGNGDGRVTLSIADDGSGVPEALRHRVFEPFFTTRTRGVGLGLAVCRTLIEAHDGSISIAGDAGSGAVVTIELPQGGSTA